MRIVVSLIFISLFSTLLYAQEIGASEVGIELYRSGEYQKAVVELEALVSRQKRDELAWIYLGAAYFKLGKQKEAAKAFRKSNLTSFDPPGVFERKVKVTSKPRASYTNHARQSMVTGTVKVAVELKADGTIGFAFPFETLPEGLTENCVRAAKAIEFEPAIKGGKPVDVISVITYSFAIY